MLDLYIPQYNDLWFRQQLMADDETMAYNHAWGGTIPFPQEDWQEWLDCWIIHPDGKRYYRYLVDSEKNRFVGEIAYHWDDRRKIHVADVIVHAKHRGRGFGAQGLQMLCAAAKSNGVAKLYDDIAIDNPAVKLFVDNGFCEEYRTDEIIMLAKAL